MKLKLKLPDELMRRVKERADESDRTLEDTVEDLIRTGLDGTARVSVKDPLQSYLRRLTILADGTVVNPDGIDDAEFFDSLEELRGRG